MVEASAFPKWFPLSEFQRKSDHTLTSVERETALFLAWQILMPLRRQFSLPIFITAFSEVSGHKAHATGRAVDIGVAGNDFQKLEAMFKWAAIHLTHAFGTLIFERDHLHITVPGFQGRHGVVLVEHVEGSYQQA